MVPVLVTEIYNEFIDTNATSPVNVDCKVLKNLYLLVNLSRRTVLGNGDNGGESQESQQMEFR